MVHGDWGAGADAAGGGDAGGGEVSAGGGECVDVEGVADGQQL